MGFIREPAVSGTFYPGRQDVLLRDIKRYMDNAVVNVQDQEIHGIISPHAGYMYSGPVAAYAFKALAGRSYDTVVVIAPSHRAYFQGVAMLNQGHYKTPLGLVEIDEELTSALLGSHRLIGANVEAHSGEHSLEVQVPFLQTILKDFKIVPMIMGTQDLPTCRALTENLSRVIRASGKKVLIVGSTDLSHYHHYDEAVRLDQIILDHLEAFDEKALLEDVEKGRAEACGAGPIVATMMLSRGLGANKGRVLKYANSGDTSGERTRVVGYVSAILYRTIN